jgi:hypothetical protein
LLSRPVITNKTIPFDSGNSYTIYFTSTGDQVFGNNLLILDNETNAIMYDVKIMSFPLQHTIPANTLANGKEYKIRVRTFNVNIASDFTNMDSTNTSDWSDTLIIKCLSTPDVDVINIPTGQVLNQTFTFMGNYYQAQGEVLQSYKFLLYDTHVSLLTASSEQFNTSAIKYEFTGFENGEDYYIELIVITKNGMQSTSGKIKFHVQYIQPKLTTILSIENVKDKAAVQVQAEVIQIIGQISSGNIYYENNEWLNVKDGVAHFKDGFKIEDNFTIKMWVKNITENVAFTKLVSNMGNIELKYFNDKIHAIKNVNGVSYQVYSDIPSPCFADDVVFIFLQQIENRLNVQAEIVYGMVRIGELNIGEFTIGQYNQK